MKYNMNDNHAERHRHRVILVYEKSGLTRSHIDELHASQPGLNDWSLSHRLGAGFGICCIEDEVECYLLIQMESVEPPRLPHIPHYAHACVVSMD